MNYIQIAIDGPAGAGKSTIAKLIAEHLNYIYIDSGAMYRAITLKAINLGIDLEDERMYEFVKDTEFKFLEGILFMDGEDVSHDIRENIVSNNVSLVSSYFFVREELVMAQQKLAKNHNIVMDGRDIGYKVLPDAKYKFYLTASIKKRAERRNIDNFERNIESNLEVIEKEIERRDFLDTTRKYSPLKAADDAVIIDTSDLAIDQVVKLITDKIMEDEKNGF